MVQRMYISLGAASLADELSTAWKHNSDEAKNSQMLKIGVTFHYVAVNLC